MRYRPTNNTRHEVASVVSSIAVVLVGAWLLVLVAGTVAIFAVLLVAGLYAPLRCRSIPGTRAAVD